MLLVKFNDRQSGKIPFGRGKKHAKFFLYIEQIRLQKEETRSSLNLLETISRHHQN